MVPKFCICFQSTIPCGLFYYFRDEKSYKNVPLKIRAQKSFIFLFHYILRPILTIIEDFKLILLALQGFVSPNAFALIFERRDTSISWIRTSLITWTIIYARDFTTFTICDTILIFLKHFYHLCRKNQIINKICIYLIIKSLREIFNK